MQCPPSIEVKQQLASQPAGWSVIPDEAAHQLAGVTFFEGNPRDRASLAPDRQTTMGGKSVALWTFGSNRDPVWIACRYASTDRVLTRELAKSVRTCTITYSTRETIDGLPVIEKIDCK